MKKIVLVLSVLSVSFCASAQSGTNHTPTDSIYTPPPVNPGPKTPPPKPSVTDKQTQYNTTPMGGHDMDGAKKQPLNTQQTPPNQDMHNPSVDVKTPSTTTTKPLMFHDGYVMKGEKVMLVKEGHETLVEKSVMMSNGITVLANGQVLKKDRTQFWMKDGDFMDMEGKLIPAGTTVTPK